MPTLSEQWATAYVQIIITLVVFALGVPAIAVQLVVQDDIRNVFHRRVRVVGWVSTVIVLLLAFIAFVWVLHPPYPKAAGAAGDPAPAGEEGVVISVAASVVMTLLPLVMIGLGIVQMRFLRRGDIVAELERELIEGFLEGQPRARGLRARAARLRDWTFKKKRAARPLDDETLHDLIYLGQHGKAGKDKRLVLDALDRIAAIVQGASTYRGEELGELIAGLMTIIHNSEQPGEDEDFDRAIEILKDIRYRHTLNPGASMYIDAGMTATVLEDLGVAAVRTRSERTVKKYLEEARSSRNSRIVFEIGLVALESRQYQTAVSALTKLEALAEAAGLADGDETSDLLGLIAHFEMGGTATRVRADEFLSGNAAAFSPSLAGCLEKAFVHHLESNNFDTADKVADLLGKLKAGSWAPLRAVAVA